MTCPSSCAEAPADPAAWIASIRAEHQREGMEQVRRHRAEVRQRRLEKALGRAGIPPRFRHKRWDNWRTEHDWQQRALQTCQRYAQRFDQVREQGTSLVMLGEPGSGKTHLACAIAQGVIEQGYTAVFTGMGQLLRALRDSYREDTTESSAVARFTDPDLLVLDEIGIAIGKEATRHAQLLDVINARYEAMKPTVLMGNMERHEMQAYLGDRIWRRITDDDAPVLALGGQS